MPNETRMTPERLAVLRRFAGSGLWGAGAVREVLAELDAVTKERDEQNANCHHQFALICEMDMQRDALRAQLDTVTSERDHAIDLCERSQKRAEDALTLLESAARADCLPCGSLNDVGGIRDA
jgi:uncharacterized coiled-coil DUF342 family protein